MRVVGAKKLIDLDLAIFNGYLISLILYRLTDRQAGVMKNYCYGFFWLSYTIMGKHFTTSLLPTLCQIISVYYLSYLPYARSFLYTIFLTCLMPDHFCILSTNFLPTLSQIVSVFYQILTYLKPDRLCILSTNYLPMSHGNSRILQKKIYMLKRLQREVMVDPTLFHLK